ncbi:threonine-phosphate decarboxylase [Aestuariibacter sp. A3R04]|uniref:threonine-phosphate decarboxylase n=1 Tax=Aestuariibacter sp. A3R04 TaxID=2841571 RepID=UPI001C09B07D|nr:threonine-phosphate decarboxylase [Aestuariibacter sp. A3R04]MBU3021235.1 aminotransferase class I/II-fold pyridoxal phosphate-dependent enzyme [Aestuariibacter sp. A3R04]
MLHHGGNVAEVAKKYSIPVGLWLDLSTGIAPVGYSVPVLPAEVWRKLPLCSASLIEAARAYYQATDVYPVSGSQQGIQALPLYRRNLGKNNGTVWVPFQGYKEHEKAWRSAGFPVRHYTTLPDVEALSHQDVVIVINPNNPSGQVQPFGKLEALHQRLAERDGWLVVDEAFGDAAASFTSAIPLAREGHCFVLRSAGKFFGLAGLRIGFVIAQQRHLQALILAIGPWSVNGPALFIMEEALNDTRWQQTQRRMLEQCSTSLHQVLKTFLGADSTGTYLFRTTYLNNAEAIHRYLCLHGIYTRLTDEKDAIRFGVPGNSDLPRLKAVLEAYSNTDGVS